jgi:hypothetical protein
MVNLGTDSLPRPPPCGFGAEIVKSHESLQALRARGFRWRHCDYRLVPLAANALACDHLGISIARSLALAVWTFAKAVAIIAVGALALR